MNTFNIKISEIKKYSNLMKCGDKVFLSGMIYTARDAAHIRIKNLLEKGRNLPFEINGSVIYYAGPTPSKNDGSIGSFGPTTSSRMDAFSPQLLDLGLAAMIGKGNRNNETTASIKRNGAVYFCACGGLGALISESVKSVEIIAFPELGCESIKKLTVENFPCFVGIDSDGNSIFDRKY